MERQAINIKRAKSIFEKRMYKNRPSKQQERKGMELMKNLIMSHKKTNQLNYSQGHIWSSTSFSKDDLKEMNRSIQKTVDKNLVQSVQLIKSQQKAYWISSKSKDNPQMRKTLGQKSNLNLGKKILNENSQIKTKNSKERAHLEESKHMKEETSRKSMQQLSLPIKGRSQSLIELPKLAPHYRKAKQKTTLQNILKLEKELVVQKEQIKSVRREFMEALQNGKRFMLQFQKDQRQISSQESFIHAQLEKFSQEKTKRFQNKVIFEISLSKVDTVLSEAKSTFESKKSHFQEQILSKQQLNSTMARKIYQLKNQLHSLHEQTHDLHKKDQRNKSLIQTILTKQQHIKNLQQQKSTLVSQHKQRMKKFIKQQIQTQDKTQIYQKLDSQLNLIKEYFKISQNAKQFKRTINKLTQFEPFYKQIETFTKSPSYSEQIMLLYRSSLWNTETPKFFESQPLILESPQIRLLKNTYKQLELKRQSLNDHLKEKEKVVDSLSYRCRKLVEQIEHLEAKKPIDEEKPEVDMFRVNRDTMDKINWGF